MNEATLPIATDRLKVRELVLSDLDPVFDTPRTETSGGRVFEKKTVPEAERWLTNRIAEQEKLGYSIWAVETTKHREFVGVCGLIPWKPSPMICYAIRKRFQGNGFGSEAARSVLLYGNSNFGSVISTIRQSNVASIRFAEKIGMRESAEAFSNQTDLKSFIYP